MPKKIRKEVLECSSIIQKNYRPTDHHLKNYRGTLICFDQDGDTEGYAHIFEVENNIIELEGKAIASREYSLLNCAKEHYKREVQINGDRISETKANDLKKEIEILKNKCKVSETQYFF